MSKKKRVDSGHVTLSQRVTALIELFFLSYGLEVELTDTSRPFVTYSSEYDQLFIQLCAYYRVRVGEEGELKKGFVTRYVNVRLLASLACFLEDHLVRESRFSVPQKSDWLYKEFVERYGRPTGQYPSRIFQQWAFRCLENSVVEDISCQSSTLDFQQGVVYGTSEC